MELFTLKEPKLVVALDIGSTYSGYAWQWRDNFQKNRSNVEFNTNWGLGGVQLHKTTTCLLLDKNHQVNSFGQLAEKRYCDICDEVDDVIGKWFFFKSFKLYLYGTKFTEKMLAEDYLGQQRPISDVMMKLIRALKDHFMQTMEDKGQPVNMDTTLWVVTVPAIWSDKAKTFMRDAAERSGIDKKRLLLAHEPESAALYCMNLPSEQRKKMNDFGGAGDKFLAVDLGGGTLDMLAIEVLSDGNLREICTGTGSRVGGQDVNNAFFQSCKDVIEGDAWHALGSKNAEELLVMETDFESKKVQIGSTNEQDEKINVPIPRSMADMLSKGEVTLKPGCDKFKYFKLLKGKLMYNSDLVREVLFQETVGLILTDVKKMLEQEELKEIKTIVLVGGFAESKIVVENIRALLSERFPHVKAVIPTSPFRAVLTGAVLFGHDPLIFQSRISRATFGVGINELFDPKQHDESKKWRHEEAGQDYCGNIFSIHVEKDQSVKLQEKQPCETYVPINKNKTEIPVNIYASSTQKPKYTTDEGCERIGQIIVNMSDTDDVSDREVKVEMIYGGTELTVIATDKTSGKEYPATLRFEGF